jgi:hypothetical protein
VLVNRDVGMLFDDKSTFVLSVKNETQYVVDYGPRRIRDGSFAVLKGGRKTERRREEILLTSLDPRLTYCIVPVVAITISFLNFVSITALVTRRFRQIHVAFYELDHRRGPSGSHWLRREYRVEVQQFSNLQHRYPTTQHPRPNGIRRGKQAI